jgi:hypothetical protein
MSGTGGSSGTTKSVFFLAIYLLPSLSNAIKTLDSLLMFIAPAMAQTTK